MVTVKSAAVCDDLVVPLDRDDLPSLDAQEVIRQNADLSHLGRIVFSVSGVPVRFRRASLAEQAEPSPPTGTWLWLTWSGLPLLAAASPALSDAVTQSLADVGVDQLGESGADLFAQLMLAPRLPAGLTLRQAALTREALRGVPQGLEPMGIWQGIHGESDESSGHVVSLWAGPGFPLSALLGAISGLASSRRASPLAALPIALPLVAARWSIDAGQLQELAVGDVLMLG